MKLDVVLASRQDKPDRQRAAAAFYETWSDKDQNSVMYVGGYFDAWFDRATIEDDELENPYFQMGYEDGKADKASFDSDD